MAKCTPDSTATVLRPHARAVNPVALGLGVIGYLGGLAILIPSTCLALVRPGDRSTSRLAPALRQADRLVGLGYGVVAAAHVGMGSFLAMQAYFGATFVDGIGPVVGVGLIRNLAPLLAGFLLAVLIAALFVADLRIDALEGPRNREVAARVLGAMIAGPILGAWGALVGVAIGWLVGRSLVGVSDPVFFDLLLEMLWARDIVGLVVKGSCFAGMAALLACHEANRPARAGEAPGGVVAISRAAARAAGLSCLAILGFNGGWFLLLYHAGPAFGPTLLLPPGR